MGTGGRPQYDVAARMEAVREASPFDFVGELRMALLQQHATGRTALHDALTLGLAPLSAGTRERQALVVLRDGGDNASHQTLDAVLLAARRSAATVDTVGLYDDTDSDRDAATLKKIAAISGGRACFPRDLDHLERVWRDIHSGTRTRYTLGYYSTNPARDGAFRRVSVTAGGAGRRDFASRSAAVHRPRTRALGRRGLPC